MLKTDLHTHSSWAHDNVSYSAKQLIRQAAKSGYDVLAITEHNYNPYNSLKSYAKKHNILLVPGVEINVGKKHVIILNTTKGKDLMHCTDFEKLKNEQAFLVAPHPFFPHPSSMRTRFFMKHRHLFDALEYSWFYSKLINFNKKVIKMGRKYDIPVIANSDLHDLRRLDRNFTLVDSKKDIDSVLDAIRKRKIRIHTQPLGELELAAMAAQIISGQFLKLLQKES
jgi:predicted metal-dependent phosphoesterase TrpH